MVASDDWLDIGRPWDLLEANERALAKLSGGMNGTVEQGAVLKGEVWVDENSIIKSGSYIEGPVCIGKLHTDPMREFDLPPASKTES